VTPKQDILVEWILEQERLRHAPTHRRLRGFASKIREFSGGMSHAGYIRVSRFLQRYPEVHAKIGEKLRQLVLTAPMQIS